MALKKAWLKRWKYAKNGIPPPITIIITPSCLKVERAITFFISISIIAAHPAINIVILPTTINIIAILKLVKIKLKRINKYTPAVTRVDECTRADTGVGAAIAAGSQEENGICALFVQADTTIKYIINLE